MCLFEELYYQVQWVEIEWQFRKKKLIYYTVFEGKNEKFLLENTSNLTHEFLYEKNLCMKFDAFSRRNVSFFPSKTRRWKAKVLHVFLIVFNQHHLEHKACSQKSGIVANVRTSRQGAKNLQFLSGCNF